MTDQDKAFRFATVTDGEAQWQLRRNCSLSPRQAGAFLLLLAVLSVSVGVFFWWQGAVLVMVFTAMELAAVTVAFVVYARHAADCECIWLQSERLVVERELAGRTERIEFAREWVRIETPTARGALIEVRSGGRKVAVGRFVRSELRPVLAQELRRALITV